jgi:hypothetical protein
MIEHTPTSELGPRRFIVRQILFWLVTLGIGFGAYGFVRDFITCWRLTSLPGIPSASCVGEPVDPLETPVLVRDTNVPPPTATLELPIVEEDEYPTWDGASRINILFVGFRGGDPKEGDCASAPTP